jgi:hypothetical protein
MATYKIQVASAVDTILPRDRIVNTFHLDDHGLGSDPQGLADDTVPVFQTLYGSTREIDCRVYPTGAPPNFPLATKVVNKGAAGGATTGPREVALCLSYYGERNLPRTRGRMYVCVAACQNVTMSANRPNAFARDQLIALADGIAGLGGVDVDWIYWSSLDGSHGPVKNAYVDDEWDVVRKRGFKPTTRTAKAYNE